MVDDINTKKCFEIAQEIRQNEETFHQIEQNFQRDLEHFQNNFKQLTNEDELLSYESFKNDNPLTQADNKNNQIITHHRIKEKLNWKKSSRVSTIQSKCCIKIDYYKYLWLSKT